MEMLGGAGREAERNKDVLGMKTSKVSESLVSLKKNIFHNDLCEKLSPPPKVIRVPEIFTLRFKSLQHWSMKDLFLKILFKSRHAKVGLLLHLTLFLGSLMAVSFYANHSFRLVIKGIFQFWSWLLLFPSTPMNSDCLLPFVSLQ